ncbi:hypothetical protein JOE63_004014 [Cellulosimicrobium cellulans]|uniref:hypothetical protein n=1 Tax=Cellulosimicrobium cellulans TaxID=1710 RepID=UPI00143163FE|nr:hypothetical protein [Cellulosimicrobium cellulans]MBM7821537.1 hypothetical protein [Cellulosimicrobium cellulans]
MPSITPPGQPVPPPAPGPRALRSAATAVALALALAACSGDTGGDGPTPVAVGAEEYQPVLEARLPVPGSAEDEVSLGLVSLVAEGSTVELRVLMTPRFADPDAEKPEEHSAYDMLGHDHNPTIVDVDALTEYDLISTGGTDLATDVVAAKTVNGRPLLYQAWFPRPAGDPVAVDVRLHESWPPFEDVPVTYEVEE